MIDRRRLLAAALALPGLAPGRAAPAPPGVDSAPALQRAIDAAQRGGGVLALPAGVRGVSRLRISGDLRLVGAGGANRLVALGPGPLLEIAGADRVTIENVAFDGASRDAGEAGLVEARDIAELGFVDCTLARAGQGLRLERCGGRIERSAFRALARSALLSLDATGLSILDNRVEDCGANGLQVWRSAQGPDGTILRGNRIARIRADPGGDGPYGNAISVFRAGGVACSGNVVRDAAFSAIRFDASPDALILGNSCAEIGETALYVEFGFQGAVVASNLVDGASTGVSVTNFDRGGRLAAVTGNVLRNCARPPPQGGALYGIGVHVEADTAVTGNVVDAAAFAGLSLGYGVGLRDVIAAENILTDCGYGVAVSVAPGAGGATIRDNRIARARHGAMVGMAWEAVASADLARDAAAYPQLTVAGNEVR
jgi:uncharacterized secreted repeat protein (TIGR03808 family)